MDSQIWRAYSGSGVGSPARSGAAPRNPGGDPLHVEADLLFTVGPPTPGPGEADTEESPPAQARVQAEGRVIRVDLGNADPAHLLPAHLRPLPLLRRTRAFLARSDLDLRIEAEGRPLLRLDPALSPGFWGRLLRLPGLRIAPRVLGVWWRRRRRP